MTCHRVHLCAVTSFETVFTLGEKTPTVHEKTRRYGEVLSESFSGKSPGGDDLEFIVVLTAARAGREWAATHLYRQYHPRLIRYLRSQEPRAADDIASETWIGVIRGLQSFHGEAPQFRTWLFSIARRQLAEFRRTAIKKYATPTDNETLTAMESGELIDNSIVEEISGQEAVQIIKDYLNHDQSEIIILRVLGDFTADQVADLMGRTPEWVRINQYRGLQKLAEIMKQKIGVTL